MLKQNILKQENSKLQHLSGMQVFLVIWVGQLVSLVGSQMTAFALGVYVFGQTGSATQFALIAMSAMLPRALLSPLAGVFADRYDRRRVMMLSDAGAALGTIVIILLLVVNQLEIWHIYLSIGIGSAFGAFQFPAYSSSIATLVSKEQIGKANGLVQLASAIGQVAAPVIAGLLVGLIPISTILMVDIGSFLAAIMTLSFIRIPAPPGQTDTGAERSFTRQIAAGWQYLVARPGLLSLMMVLVIGNFFVGTAAVLLAPMILSFESAATLGLIESIGGAGLLVGGILMSIWGGGERRVKTILGFYIMLGVGVLMVGLRPSVILIAISAFIAYFSLPFIIGTFNTVLSSKVSNEFQGRVFALRAALIQASFAIAYLSAGPLADHIFNPLLGYDGMMASTVGEIIGVGDGRGIGLMFVLMGFMAISTVIVGYAYPRLRKLEDEIPDVTS